MEGAIVEVGDVRQVLEAELALLGERGGALVLVDARPVRSMTRAAQRLTAEHPAAARTDALAIMVEGPVSRMLGNFFMSVSRPTYPTRLFTEEAAARAWLQRCRG